MDDRHWWFATKLQETFHFGGYDSPTLLEDFLSEPDVIKLINSFLGPGEPLKLFFYCDPIDQQLTGESRTLNVVSTLGKDTVLESGTCLYALRRESRIEVDATQLEKEVCCGEIKFSVMTSFGTLLTEGFAPLLKSQQQWKDASKETITQFLQTLDKYTQVIAEPVSQAYQPLLTKPSVPIKTEMVQSGKSTTLLELQEDCEELAGDWISTIETYLLEGMDEKYIDPHSNPLTELSKWQRKQLVMNTIIEQLKTRECKNIITALVVLKSKLLKKWKAVDCLISDAYNDARDKVKYLEALKQVFEQLQCNQTPMAAASNILPSLSNAVKQMMGQSRVYAKSGFLGFLFMKVSNQLSSICYQYIESFCRSAEDHTDHFWSKLLTDVEQQRASAESPLIPALKSCLLLHKSYKDMLLHLKDLLLTVSTVNLTSGTVGGARKSPVKGSKKAEKSSATVNGASTNMGSILSISFDPTSHFHGIALNQVDKIMEHFDQFQLRVMEVLEIRKTVDQFQSLPIALEGLPHILGIWNIDFLLKDNQFKTYELRGGDTSTLLASTGGIPQSRKHTDSHQSAHSHGHWGMSSHRKSPHHGGSTISQQSRKISSTHSSTPAADGIVSRASSRKQNVSRASHLDVESEDTEHTSVATMVLLLLKKALFDLKYSCARGFSIVFDTESTSDDVFPEAYIFFNQNIAAIEGNLAEYIKYIVEWDLSSTELLSIIAKFKAVAQRSNLKLLIHESTMDIFRKYTNELEQIQAIYEANKDNPPTLRSKPLAVTTIAWSRHLSSKIEIPMKTFRETKFIMQSKESQYCIKLYNKLALALSTFENLYMTQWKSSISAATKSLQTTLLKHKVNSDGSIIVEVTLDNVVTEVMTAAKTLKQLNVDIPDAALQMLKQEVQVKKYKQQMEETLDDFYQTYNLVEPAMRPLLQQYSEEVIKSLSPGWTSLHWKSMNIDVFLHKVHADIVQMKGAVTTINANMAKIHEVLASIASSKLFDLMIATAEVWDPDKFSTEMIANVGMISEQIMVKIEEMEECIMAVMSVSTGVAQILKRLTMSTLHTPSSSSKPHSTRESIVPEEHSFRHHSRSRNSSAASTPSGSDGSHSLPRGSITSPAPSPRVAAGNTKKLSQTVTLKTVEKKPSIFEQLISVLHSENKQNELAILHYFSKLLGNALLAAITGSLTLFKTSVTPRHNKSVSTHNDNNTTSNNATTLLEFTTNITFVIPESRLIPDLKSIQANVNQVCTSIVAILQSIVWWGGSHSGKPLYADLKNDTKLTELLDFTTSCILELKDGVDAHLNGLKMYDYLWEDELHTMYKVFSDSKPQLEYCKAELEKLQSLENQISSLPVVFSVGSLNMTTEPVKNFLEGLAVRKKAKYASLLHDRARTILNEAVYIRERIRRQLSGEVMDISDLKMSLETLQEFSELENTIDSTYLPVEQLYFLLRNCNPRLPRSEVERVDNLRTEWKKLTELVDKVRHRLLVTQRFVFEQEVDKKAKALMVDSIQFRNSFDTEGPLIPGLSCEDAMEKLEEYMTLYLEHASDEKLLHDVQRLMDIQPVEFPELIRTQQDLQYAEALYGTYSKFLEFDKNFRDQLWAEVDLDSTVVEVEDFWGQVEKMPCKQCDWDASRKLSYEINQYREVLPLLKRLHSKEIRNRHWLQIMAVTSCTFQLEATVFRMAHILDAHLSQHKIEIEEIIECALKELNLELQLNSVEEEWAEQMLQFEPYKNRGQIFLSQEHTYTLVEQLEDSQTVISSMLMLKHMAPMRQRASDWVFKLAAVNEILQQWMVVQNLWHNLEAVFSNMDFAKDFPQESVIFTNIDKKWTAFMCKAFETQGVIQCCLECEVSRKVQLTKFGQELEECKKSLASYLLSKRQAFPQFYFITDPTLLSILSDSTSVAAIKPHLRSLFGNVASLVMLDSTGDGISSSGSIKDGGSAIVTGVQSVEGEVLELTQPVTISENVEKWLSSLVDNTHETIGSLMHDIVLECGALSVDDCACKYPTQVAGIAMYFQWTKDCENALSQCRYDRRAIPNARSKFINLVINRLCTQLTKNKWRRTDVLLSPSDRAKLESLAMLGMWLRDALDFLCHQKLRELTDFEWQQFLRLYIQEDPVSKRQTPVFQCLDVQLSYHCEFTGCQSLPPYSPRLGNCLIALIQAISKNCGGELIGPADSMKTEIMKGLGLMCGRNVLTFDCCELTCKPAVVAFLKGAAQAGTWVCFNSVHDLSAAVMSTMAQLMQIVTAALRAKASSCVLITGETMPVLNGFGVFLTHPYSKNWRLPTTLTSMFRSFTLTTPDFNAVLKSLCSILGYQARRLLVERLVVLRTLCKEQLSRDVLSLPFLMHILLVAANSYQQRTPSAGNKETPQTRESSTSQRQSQPTSTSHMAGAGRNAGVELRNQRALTPTHGGAKIDHNVVFQALKELVSPRFDGTDLIIFENILNDVFYGLKELVNVTTSPRRKKQSHPQNKSPVKPSTAQQTPINTPTNRLQHQHATPVKQNFVEAGINTIIAKQAVILGFEPGVAWAQKVLQLYTITQVKHAVVLAGHHATGKTSSLSTVISVCNVTHRHSSATVSTRLQRINPAVFDSLETLYGHVNSTGDWVDGVFTAALRKALKATQAKTWICFDGPLSGTWVDILEGLISKDKILSLPTGERLFVKDEYFHLIFETSDLSNASPIALAHCGIVYHGSSTLGWKELSRSWLVDRRVSEVQCLEKLFDVYMNPIVEFIKDNTKVTLSEVGMFQSTLAFLTSLLNIYFEAAEVFSELHVERLLLFSLIWGFGGSLLPHDRQKFSQFLKSLSNSLPDDDSDLLVFDYFVDESGEWDTWHSSATEDSGGGMHFLNPMGSVFLETNSLVCIETLIDLAHQSMKHVILTGPRFCGKSSIINNFLTGRGVRHSATEMTAKLVLTGNTPVKNLHSFIQVNFHQKQGHVYGPQNGKIMNLFIDDLHLPVVKDDGTGLGNVSEFFRLLVDVQGLYNLKKKNEWSSLEDFVFLATANTDHPSSTVTDRLLSRFAVIRVPEWTTSTLESTASTLAEAILLASPVRISKDLINKVTNASVQLYTSIKNVLRDSTLPGRYHYMFSFRHLVSLFQGLCHCGQTFWKDSVSAGFIWSHEAKRVFHSGLARIRDAEWLQDQLQSVSNKWFPSDTGSSSTFTAPLALSAIPLEVEHVDEPAEGVPLNQLPQVKLYPINKWQDLLNSVECYLLRYCEEFEFDECPLVLSDFVLRQLMRLHRAVNFASGGHCLLVGSLGSDLVTLAKLSLYIARFNFHTVDCSNMKAFDESMRGLFRLSGLEGQPTATVFTADDIENKLILETLNSILAIGDVPTLFSNDEVDGLLEALEPSIKRDFPSQAVNPMDYFTSRIRRNMHIIICLPSTHPLLNEDAYKYPGIYKGCCVIDTAEWSLECLQETASCFFKNDDNLSLPPELISAIGKCSADIHFYVLREAHLLHRAGLYSTHDINVALNTKPKSATARPLSAIQQFQSDPPPITLTSPSQQVKDNPLSINQPMNSYECLMEAINSLNTRPSVVDGTLDINDINSPYVCPETYHRFLICFSSLFKEKYYHATKLKENLSIALATLSRTQEEANAIEDTLKAVRLHQQETSDGMMQLFTALTTKTNHFERIKANLGQQSSVLSAIRVLKEQERKLLVEDTDDYLLSLVQDSTGRKNSKFEQSMLRAKEELAKAEEEETKAKEMLGKAKEQALQWQSKIDRNTIDQIKSLINPPALVGVIMEMMLTLLHHNSLGDTPTDGSDESLGAHHSSIMNLQKKRSANTLQNSKLDREQWQAIQLAIGDSQKFLDLLGAFKWENGLDTYSINLIESMLVTSKNSDQLQNMAQASPSSASGPTALISVSTARYASEAVAIMCAYVIAIVDYHYLIEPCQQASDIVLRCMNAYRKLQNSSRNMSSVEEVEFIPITHRFLSSTAEGVDEIAELEEDELQNEIESIECEYDKLVIKKHKLGLECTNLSEKLKLAKQLLESLKLKRDTWETQLEEFATIEILASNCILAAAFTVYCAPLKSHSRIILSKAICHVCSMNGLPQSTVVLDEQKEHSYACFMMGPPNVYHLNVECLPIDSTCEQNISIITQQYTKCWPLIIDPLDLLLFWFKNKKNAEIVCIKDLPLLSKKVEACLTTGNSLVITEVYTQSVLKVKAVMDLIKSAQKLSTIRTPCKLMIDGKEIECKPGFRLFLITSDNINAIPDIVISLTTVVLFYPEKKGIKDLILTLFLQKFYPKVYSERTKLNESVFDQLVTLKQLEDKMLQVLAQEEHLDEARVAKLLGNLSSAFDEGIENLVRSKEQLQVANEITLSGIKGLMGRMATILSVIFIMGKLSPHYAYGFRQTASLLLTIYEQTGRAQQAEDLTTSLTVIAHHHYIHGYFENEKLLFSLLLALELEALEGRIFKNEREFLISPFPGTKYVIRGLTYQQSMPDNAPVLNFGKRPFDWMTEEQWQSLLMLASHFSWIHDLLDKINKDNKETFWRTLGEGLAPETMPTIDSLSEKLTALQKLLILRALRPERATQSVMLFITNVLGKKRKKFTYNTLVDFSAVLKISKVYSPILLIFKEDPDIVVPLVHQAASKKHVHLEVLYLTDSDPMELNMAISTVQNAVKQEYWLLLHNVSYCAPLLEEIPLLLKTASGKLSEETTFRLWISSSANHCLPTRLLHCCTKVVIDSPLSIHTSVMHSLTCIPLDVFRSSNRVEWLPLLHSIAMMHASLRLRGHVCPYSWSNSYHWNYNYLMDAVRFAGKDFSGVDAMIPHGGVARLPSWAGIRNMITQVWYGGQVVNEDDATLVTAITEQWVYPIMNRKDLDIVRGRYHMPLVFLVPHTRLSNLVQAVETMSPPLVLTAEVLGMYYTARMKLGIEDSLFSKLTGLFMLLSKSTSPLLTGFTFHNIDQHLTSTSPMPPLSGKNSHYLQTQMSAKSERSTPHGTVVSPLSSLHPTSSQMTSSTTSLSVTKPTHDIPLSYTVEKLLERLPTGWKKDHLNEKLRKLGPQTPFGVFMANETSHMLECLRHIRSSLQDLQRILIDESLGDQNTPELLETARRLTNQLVPTHWVTAVGPTAPPDNYPLHLWIKTIAQRYYYIEKVLSLGRDKVPTYWLGAFFNPLALLCILKQDTMAKNIQKTGNFEPYTLKVDFTNREKEHIRDPPAEGIFAYGLFMWGCEWEKNASLELHDSPPKPPIPSPLPLTHITAVPLSEAPSTSPSDQPKGPYLYLCPCYGSLREKGKILMHVSINSIEIMPNRWALRGLFCTIRPF